MIMAEHITSSEVRQIMNAKRVDRVIMSLEEMEIDNLAQPQAWFNLSLLHMDTDMDGQPKFSIEEIRTIRCSFTAEGSKRTWEAERP